MGEKWRIEGVIDGNIMLFKMISKWHKDDYFNDCKCVVSLCGNRCENGKWDGVGHFDRRSYRRNFSLTEGGVFYMNRPDDTRERSRE